MIELNNDRLVAGGAGVCVRRGGCCTSQDPTTVPATGAGRGDRRDSAVSRCRPPAITCLFCASHPGGGVGRPLRRPPAERHAGALARQPAPACRFTPATSLIGPFRPHLPVPVPGRAGRCRRQAPAPRRARRRRCTDRLTPPGISRSGRVTPRRPEASAPAHGTWHAAPEPCQMRRTRGATSPDLEVSLVPISRCRGSDTTDRVGR